VFWLRRSVMILVAACWPACLLQAQSEPEPGWKYKVEIFGNVAAGRFYNGDSLWGRGFDYGGGFGVRPFSGWPRRLGFEFQIARLKNSTQLGPSNSQELDSRLVMANVLYHFRSGTRLQPFVFGGIGHVKTDYNRSCGTCVFDLDDVTGQQIPVPYESQTRASKTGFTLGGGLKIAIGRRLSIRPELFLADTTPGFGWNWLWLRPQIGLGLHF